MREELISMNEKMIGGFPVSKWRKAFALAVNIAIDQDYFSDTLFYDLYPNIHEEAVALGLRDDDEEAIDDVYNAKWDYVDEAFKEVFGMAREQAWRLEDN
jgi:hypothetical protein